MFDPFKFFFRRLKKILSKIRKYKYDSIFIIESIVLSHINKWLKLHPSSEPYLSGDTYRGFSNVVFDPKKGFSAEISRCDLVYVSLEDIEVFRDNISALKTDIIVVSHQSDRSFDSEYLDLLENKKILHWYAQNSLFKHKKLSAIPIGLEDAWRHNNGVISDFKRIYNATPISKKNTRILFGFSVETNLHERVPAHNVLIKSKIADHINKPARAYRRELEKYMFVASPPGNGIDCHRTWEALYLGCIPIVLKGSVNENFPELPVLYVNRWEDILEFDEYQLRSEYNRISSRIPDCKIIWASYWKEEFKYRQGICKND